MKFLILLFSAIVPSIALASSFESESLSDVAKEELFVDSSTKPEQTMTAPRSQHLATVSVHKNQRAFKLTSHWRLGIRYQKMKISGTPSLDFVHQENFSESVSSINFYSATLYKNFTSKTLAGSHWGLGLIMAGGQADATASSTSGRVIKDLKFQVLQTAADVYGCWPLWKRLHFISHIQAGAMNFTQSSPNTSARFSHSTIFLAPAAGLSINLGKGFLFSMMFENRLFPKRSDIVSEAHQFLLTLEKDWL